MSVSPSIVHRNLAMTNSSYPDMLEYRKIQQLFIYFNHIFILFAYLLYFFIYLLHVFYKKLGSAHSTKSFLISHENFAIIVLTVS